MMKLKRGKCAKRAGAKPLVRMVRKGHSNSGDFDNIFFFVVCTFSLYKDHLLPWFWTYFVPYVVVNS